MPTPRLALAPSPIGRRVRPWGPGQIREARSWVAPRAIFAGAGRYVAAARVSSHTAHGSVDAPVGCRGNTVVPLRQRREISRTRPVACKLSVFVAYAAGLELLITIPI